MSAKDAHYGGELVDGALRSFIRTAKEIISFKLKRLALTALLIR